MNRCAKGISIFLGAIVVVVLVVGWFVQPPPIFMASFSNDVESVWSMLKAKQTTSTTVDSLEVQLFKSSNGLELDITGISPDDITQERDSWGNSVLHWAAKGGSLDVVELFLEIGVKPKQIVNHHGTSALHWATLSAGSNTEAMIQKLVDNGVDVDCTNKDGETPLHWSVLWERETPAMVLLKLGANPNALDVSGESPMHLINFGSCRNVQIATIDDSTKDDSKQSIHGGMKCPASARIMEALVQRGGDMKLQNSVGESPHDRMVKMFEQDAQINGQAEFFESIKDRTEL